MVGRQVALYFAWSRPDEVTAPLGILEDRFPALFELRRLYLIARRMAEAAFLLESSDEGIARIASRVGYETAAAFSKLFHRHHGLSPGRYRATTRRSDGGQRQREVLEVGTAD